MGIVALFGFFQDLPQQHVLTNSLEIRLHIIADFHGAQQIDIVSTHHPDPLAKQLGFVDGIPVEFLHRHQADDAAGHQRQDDFKIVGQFKNGENCGNRRQSGSGDHRAHADQAIGRGSAHFPREYQSGRRTEHAAEQRTKHQGRRKDAAREARPHRTRRSQKFEQQHHCHESDSHLRGQNLINGFISDTKNMGPPKRHYAQHQTSDSRPELKRHPGAGEKILGGRDRADKKNRQQTGQKTKERIQREFCIADKFV